jgi:cytochrome c-type biogenesis protein
VGYVGAEIEEAPGRRRSPAVALSVNFFAGLVLGLLVLGVAAAIVGRLLAEWKVGFAVGAAVISFLIGVAALLGPHLRRRIPDPAVRRRTGAAGAFVYGLLYSVATLTTSAGPLMLLLTVAAAIGRPAYAAALSFSYAVGRGLPFLALGLFAGRLSRWVARIERARRPVEVASGVALVGVAVYFVWLAGALRASGV